MPETKYPLPHSQVPMKDSQGDESLSSSALLSRTVDFNPPLISCMAMLLGLLGKPTSTEALKSGMPIDARGFSPGVCLRAAEQVGVTAKILHRPNLEKISSLTLPCILLLENDEACVLKALDGEEAEVIFAEFGNDSKRVAISHLKSDYTGYAIFCQPKGRLDPRASDLRLLDTKKWFWGAILKFWPIYKHVLLATLIVNTLAIASPLFVMNVYDRVVPNNAIDTLWVLAVGIILAYFFDFILRNMRGYFVDTAGKGADVIIASKLMQQLMSMRFDHKPESTGSLANNLRDFESLREFFSSTTLLALLDLPFILIFTGIIAYVGGPLALIPAIAVPIVVLVGLLIQVPFKRLIEDGFKEATQKNALLIEVISGLETIKTCQADGQIQKRWEEVVGMHARSSAHTRGLMNFSISFSMLSAHLVSVGIIIWGVYLITAGNLTMGGLIACNILAGRVMAPLGAIAAMLTRLQHSRMSLKALDLLMQVPNERPLDHEPLRHDHLSGSVTFDEVSFHYPQSEKLALQSTNLTIGEGEKVGIIGRVGSGKSTLGRLILGLYQPQEGAVKVGNIDIRQLDIAELRSKIGYVAQDSYLFYGSIRDNISKGMPYADDRSIIRAATIAGVIDFVRTQPAGFGMQVGERGQNLSGGQRQAVAIARTLLKNPDVLILDEPTSSLDNATEAIFRSRLADEIKNKTLILITHRHSMLTLVNRLIVLDNGRVIADGPKDAILNALKNDRIHIPKT